MLKNKNKNRVNLKSVLIKLFFCLLYMFVIVVLIYSSYSIFKDEDKIVSWKNVEKTNQYAYLEITQMSEAFAQINNKQIHLVMEKESTGAWHTYLIAIKKEDYNKYKSIIDFTYERTTESPKPIKVYGYPKEIPTNVKALAIKNITKFVPIENQVVINEDNFEKYLTNTYLDTTMEKTHPFNYYVLSLLIMSFIMFIIIIYTIIEKDKSKPKKSKKNNSRKRIKNQAKPGEKNKETNKKKNIEKTNNKKEPALKKNTNNTSVAPKSKLTNQKKKNADVLQEPKKTNSSKKDTSKKENKKKAKDEDLEII